MPEAFELTRDDTITFFQRVAAHFPYRTPRHSPERGQSPSHWQTVEIVQQGMQPLPDQPDLNRVRQNERNAEAEPEKDLDPERAFAQSADGYPFQSHSEYADREGYHHRHYPKVILSQSDSDLFQWLFCAFTAEHRHHGPAECLVRNGQIFLFRQPRPVVAKQSQATETEPEPHVH